MLFKLKIHHIFNKCYFKLSKMFVFVYFIILRSASFDNKILFYIFDTIRENALI